MLESYHACFITEAQDHAGQRSLVYSTRDIVDHYGHVVIILVLQRLSCGESDLMETIEQRRNFACLPYLLKIASLSDTLPTVTD
jgi:hypothetical protein